MPIFLVTRQSINTLTQFKLNKCADRVALDHTSNEAEIKEHFPLNSCFSRIATENGKTKYLETIWKRLIKCRYYRRQSHTINIERQKKKSN